MVLNDLVDSFCYSLKNVGLKGLKPSHSLTDGGVIVAVVKCSVFRWRLGARRSVEGTDDNSCRCSNIFIFVSSEHANFCTRYTVNFTPSLLVIVLW